MPATRGRRHLGTGISLAFNPRLGVEGCDH